MTSESGPLMEEHVLRRSLRLDADEVPPRLDPALIAAAATTSSPSGSGLGLAVVVAFAGGWLWSEIFRVCSRASSPRRAWMSSRRPSI